jgi:hypothetical protein
MHLPQAALGLTGDLRPKPNAAPTQHAGAPLRRRTDGSAMSTTNRKTTSNTTPANTPTKRDPMTPTTRSTVTTPAASTTPLSQDTTMTRTARTEASALAHNLRFFASTYAAAAAHDLVLSAFPTLGDVVAYLHFAGQDLAPAHRPRILRALVTLAQRTRHVVWSELLLIAYRPLLSRFLRVTGTDPAEHHAQVVACFFEAVATVSVKASSISYEITQRVEKLLAAAALADREWNQVVRVDDIEAFAAPEAAVCEELSMGSKVTGDISDEDLLQTFTEHGALIDLVHAHYPDLPAADQTRVYNKLLQRRAKLGRLVRERRARSVRRMG